MKIVIADIPENALKMKSIIKNIDSSEEVLTVESIKDLRVWIKNNGLPDITILSLLFEKEDLEKLFAEIQFNKPLIFTGGGDLNAIKASLLYRIKYLPHPFDEDSVRNVFTDLKKLNEIKAVISPKMFINELMVTISESKNNYLSHILALSETGFISLSVDDIIYFEQCREEVQIILEDGKSYLADYRLEELGIILNPDHFLESSQGEYLYNKNHKAEFKKLTA